jgi:uncharacterized membrane protein YkgB
MVCGISCAISAIFIIGMIYFYELTNQDEIVKEFKNKLSPELQNRYDRIIDERKTISYHGYLLGFVLSLLIIFYNLRIKKQKMNNLSLICTVIAVSFLTNYFYYMLTPKSDWMLNHMENQEEVKAWLVIYKKMQYNYHMGIVLGIIAVGVFAFAFRGFLEKS